MKEIKVKNLKTIVDDSVLKQPPKLITEVVPVKKEILLDNGEKEYKIQKNKYEIRVIHPNTRQVLLTKIIKNELGIMSAMDEANKFRDELNVQIIECKNEEEALKMLEEISKDREDVIVTWYKETKFIPKPKRGKSKLHTKNGIVDGDITKEDFDKLEDMDYSHNKDIEIDAEFFELDRQIAKNIEKKAKKSPKKLNKDKKSEKKVKKNDKKSKKRK